LDGKNAVFILSILPLKRIVVRCGKIVLFHPTTVIAYLSYRYEVVVRRVG